MNAKNFQSLWAGVLLIGCILVGLGGWGAWYSSSRSAQEKEAQWALKERQLNDEIAALQQADAPPEAAALHTPKPVQPYYLDGTAVVTAPKPKATPALITSDSGSAPALPSTPVSPLGGSWSLNDKQRQKIVDSLGIHSGKTITICSVQSDNDGTKFAATLKRMFEEAGWHVDAVRQVAYSKPPSGLNLASGSFPSPEALVAAYHAFASAGFHVSQQLDSKLTGGDVELIVGAVQ